jgi:hypothetical protein
MLSHLSPIFMHSAPSMYAQDARPRTAPIPAADASDAAGDGGANSAFKGMKSRWLTSFEAGGPGTERQAPPPQPLRRREASPGGAGGAGTASTSEAAARRSGGGGPPGRGEADSPARCRPEQKWQAAAATRPPPPPPHPAARPPPPPPAPAPTRRNPAPIAFLDPSPRGAPRPLDLGIVVDLSRVGSPGELWRAAASALSIKARGGGEGGGLGSPRLLLPPLPPRVRVVYQDSSGDLLVLAPGEPWGRLVSSARRVILSVGA